MEWVKPRSQQDLPAEPKVAYKYVHFKILAICMCRLGKYFTSLNVDAIKYDDVKEAASIFLKTNLGHTSLC